MTGNQVSNLRVAPSGNQLIIGFELLQGAGDSLLVEHWEEILEQVSEHNAETIIVDLSNSPSISSSSISVLLSLYRKNLTVKLYQPGPSVKDVLGVTQLQDFFPEVDSLPQAS